ncbi:MAG TPA: hypothetical protein PLS53_11725 [Thermoanaerobaculaceae bacterium]|nr:hypothetical protein [Thermoanaerobaculaceae bacterium]
MLIALLAAISGQGGVSVGGGQEAPPPPRDMEQLIVELGSHDQLVAFNAYMALWRLGPTAIPPLLKVARDPRESTLQIPTHPLLNGSIAVKGSEDRDACQSRGLVALYLIEAIRVNSLIHCESPSFQYSDDSAIPPDLRQVHDQIRAAQDYETWWSKWGNRGEMQSNKVIAPWVGALWVFPEEDGFNEQLERVLLGEAERQARSGRCGKGK